MQFLPDRAVSLVSIHAPREGCDNGYFKAITEHIQFQFTHPGRGATVWYAR